MIIYTSAMALSRNKSIKQVLLDGDRCVEREWSCIRWYHVYEDVWEASIVEKLVFIFTVVKKEVVVGTLTTQNFPCMSVFLRKHGSILGQVIQEDENIHSIWKQGGMEMLAKVSGTRKEVHKISRHLASKKGFTTLGIVL